ncbi:hypothetical protein BJ138DRAFT_794418 [Hygrophoropsis aurantiaca]|uniref:Uncharacterized protein n=1 Tax=Hygrophoropsis aurantiaca TaxID=72124 RepID=A0ACB8AGH2_9AGAM|nr:hypothetical protein BJ138DRAFT_794418 [Hygrophoropsis aurantiaca]
MDTTSITIASTKSCIDDSLSVQVACLTQLVNFLSQKLQTTHEEYIKFRSNLLPELSDTFQEKDKLRLAIKNLRQEMNDQFTAHAAEVSDLKLAVSREQTARAALEIEIQALKSTLSPNEGTSSRVQIHPEVARRLIERGVMPACATPKKGRGRSPRKLKKANRPLIQAPPPQESDLANDTLDRITFTAPVPETESELLTSIILPCVPAIEPIQTLAEATNFPASCLAGTSTSHAAPTNVLAIPRTALANKTNSVASTHTPAIAKKPRPSMLPALGSRIARKSALGKGKGRAENDIPASVPAIMLQGPQEIAPAVLVDMSFEGSRRRKGLSKKNKNIICVSPDFLHPI